MRQVILYPDREDGGWVAEVPSLPGCLSQGQTKEQAIANIRDAIDTWIDGTSKWGFQFQTTVPDHREVGRGTLRSIIRQAGLTVDEFVALL